MELSSKKVIRCARTTEKGKTMTLFKTSGRKRASLIFFGGGGELKLHGMTINKKGREEGGGIYANWYVHCGGFCCIGFIIGCM